MGGHAVQSHAAAQRELGVGHHALLEFVHVEFGIVRKVVPATTRALNLLSKLVCHELGKLDHIALAGGRHQARVGELLAGGIHEGAPPLVVALLLARLARLAAQALHAGARLLRHGVHVDHAAHHLAHKVIEVLVRDLGLCRKREANRREVLHRAARAQTGAGHKRKVLALGMNLVVGEVRKQERKNSRTHVGQAQKALLGEIEDVLIERLRTKRCTGTLEGPSLVGIVAGGAHKGLARGLQGVLHLVGVGGDRERHNAGHIGGDRHRHGHVALLVGVLNNVARAGHLVLRLDGKQLAQGNGSLSHVKNPLVCEASPPRPLQ